MQGNRTSEQQGKICLTHGARASAPNQDLTAQPGTRASTPLPKTALATVLEFGGYASERSDAARLEVGYA